MRMKFKSTTLNPKALVYRRFIEISASYNQNVVYKTTDDKYWLFDQNEVKFIKTNSRENVVVIGNLDMLKFYNSYFRYIEGWKKFEENEIYKKEDQNVSEHYDLSTHSFEYGVSFEPQSKLSNFSVELYYENENIPYVDVYGYITQNNKKYEIQRTSITSGTKRLLTASTEGVNIIASSTQIVLYFSNNAMEGTLCEVEYKMVAENLLSAKFNNIAKYQLNKYYYVGSIDYMQRGGISNTTTQYIKGNIIPLISLNIKYFNDYIKLRPDDLVVIKGKLYSVENPEEDHKHQPQDYTVYFATLNSIL